MSASSREEVVDFRPMMRFGIHGINTLRIFDTAGKPIEIGAIGKNGMFFVFVGAKDFGIGTLDKNPGLFSADGKMIADHVAGMTILDVLTLLHNDVKKSGFKSSGYYKDFTENEDGTFSFRIILSSPLHSEEEMFFETELKISRVPEGLVHRAYSYLE
jgi:hypothetical protein